MAKRDPAEERVNALKARIRSVFSLFDSQSNDTIDVLEVPTVVRAMGVYPTEKELHDFIQSCQEEEPTNFVRLAKFEVLLIDLITAGKSKRVAEDYVLRAFQILDKDNKGYLTREELESMMKTSGEPLQDQEMDAFLKGLEVAGCIDAASGNIYYAKYAAVLAESTSDHPGAMNTA